jgi:hypothetical protein
MVTISGNNRTKPSLVGCEAVVKRAVGLGGWHWLVSRLQRGKLRICSSAECDWIGSAWQLVGPGLLLVAAKTPLSAVWY